MSKNKDRIQELEDEIQDRKSKSLTTNLLEAELKGFKEGQASCKKCEKIRKFCLGFGRSNLVSKSQIQDILNDEEESEDDENL